MKHYREEPGKSLNASIKGMAKRDESFNEFLRAFKAKNEQKWANIIDMTQAEQEELLLAKSPEYRRNEMVMLEEFRRRKNMKNYYDLMREKRRRFDNWHGRDERKVNYMEFDKEGQESWDFKTTGPERYLEPKRDEIFKPSDFTLIFIDSDSVTNVTRLNRVNHRRVLIWAGNAKGVISYGKGKGIDYENAFDNAFKSLRENMVCISWDL